MSDDNPCSQEKVNFYKQCQLSTTAQKVLDVEKAAKPWLKSALTIGCAVVGMAAGPEGAMMGAMLGGGLADGYSNSISLIDTERETCGKAADLCATNQAIQDTITGLDKITTMTEEQIQQFTTDVNDHLQSYYNGSEDIRTHYADKQKTIALMGWRVAIIIFFIVMFDIFGMWPLSKIWNPTNYGNLATKTNVKSMFAAFKKNIKLR